MALGPGVRLGPYEIVARAGAGGMGEVYKAHDTRLQRTVAIKVLPPERTSDSGARQRLEREARAVAALSHPNVCPLFDVGQQDGVDYLVMEYLEGEALAQRLVRGKLPLDQALKYGVQIADALAAAHKAGIVHRDLKPGNIILAKSGAQLLDFGLAKSRAKSAEPDLTQVATQEPLTAEGTLVGTLQYMAPEQVHGNAADARSDIFALGAILYEMVTGQRAFQAATQASLIAKILETDVPLVSTLVPAVPPALDHVIHMCLRKGAADRWQNAQDVKLQLEWILAGGAQSAPAYGGRADQRRQWWPWVVTLATVAVAATVLGRALSSQPVLRRPLPMRFDLILPPEMQLDEYDRGAISPDGRQFVLSATVNGDRQLVHRDMASARLIVIPDTKGGTRPFWSPDSQSIAFLVQPAGRLKRVLLAGGPARDLGELPGVSYEDRGTWSQSIILFGPRDGRIVRITDTGGTPTPLDLVSGATGQKDLSFPGFLPDGQHFFVTVESEPAVYAGSLQGGGVRKVLDDATAAVYAAGHVLYSRGAGLFARTFDPDRQQVSGAEVQLASQAESFSVSERGDVVFRPELVPRSRLTWFDRSGRRTGTLGADGPFEQVVLSPGGHHATVVQLDAHRHGDLWDWDLRTGVFSRLTTDPAHDTDPSWSPDERTLAFTSERAGDPAMFLRDSVSGKEEPLLPFREAVSIDQWTPDGRFVVFRTFGKAVYAASPGPDRTPRMLADTRYVEDEVHVSPDGRWVAFGADESGRWEVYVAAFPDFTSKRQISTGGGVQPQWRGDGQELFYLAPDGSMMSVAIEAGKELSAKPPVRLFTTNIAAQSGTPQFAVARDGQRFLALDRTQGATSFTFLVDAVHADVADVPGVPER